MLELYLPPVAAADACTTTLRRPAITRERGEMSGRARGPIIAFDQFGPRIGLEMAGWRRLR